MVPWQQDPVVGTELTTSSSGGYIWSLEWKSVSDQILLLNTTTGLPAQNAVRYVAPGETKTLEEMNLMATFVSRSTNEQDLVWSVPASIDAVVDRQTGTVTGLSYRGTPSIMVLHRTLSVDSASYTLSVTIAPTSPPLKPQETSTWCWVATAQMFALKCYPNITATQADAVAHVSTISDEGGIPDNIVEAIKYFISTVTVRPGNVVRTQRGTVLTEEGLIGCLESGSPVLAARGKYINNVFAAGNRNNGHSVLIAGYVQVSGVNYFLVMDPWEVNEGSTYGLTYAQLLEYNCPNGRGTFFWDMATVLYSEYYNDTFVRY